jgi:hypothetical protein
VTTPFLEMDRSIIKRQGQQLSNLKTERQERENDGDDKVESGESESSFREVLDDCVSLHLAISQRHCTMLILKV